jgi:hypothetical protein
MADFANEYLSPQSKSLFGKSTVSGISFGFGTLESAGMYILAIASSQLPTSSQKKRFFDKRYIYVFYIVVSEGCEEEPVRASQVLGAERIMVFGATVVRGDGVEEGVMYLLRYNWTKRKRP